MATQIFYETATKGAENTEPRQIAKYLQTRFEEEKRQNPQCIGGSYTGGKISFRYAPTFAKKPMTDLELLQTKLFWAKYRPAPDKKTQQDREWTKTKLFWAKHGIFI